MNIEVASEQQIVREGEGAPDKIPWRGENCEILSAWRQGAGDYLKIREKLFDGETVDSLYDKIVEFEKAEA